MIFIHAAHLAAIVAFHSDSSMGWMRRRSVTQQKGCVVVLPFMLLTLTRLSPWGIEVSLVLILHTVSQQSYYIEDGFLS